MDMRAFTKSMLTMPWALSMFSLQQAANLLSPSTTNRFDAAGRAMDDVAAAASHDFDGWARQTYEFGATVQQSLVDIMMLRPPAMDSGRMMRTVQEFQSNPIFQAMMQYGMPPVGWAGSLLKNTTSFPTPGQIAAHIWETSTTGYANLTGTMGHRLHTATPAGASSGSIQEDTRLVPVAGGSASEDSPLLEQELLSDEEENDEEAPDEDPREHFWKNLFISMVLMLGGTGIVAVFRHVFGGEG